jgi:hypothetical protein
MTTDGAPALAGIIESARRLGVELDEAEAAEWVAALSVESAGGDVVVDVDSGIFGHRASMLDFTPGDLARFRAMGEVVGFPDRPPEVRTALALSGSAAQGKVQAYPGDCDYFERIHISAPTRQAACERLAFEMRDKALSTRVGPTFRLWEVKFGSYPFDGERAGKPVAKGAPISWTADEVATGAIVVNRDGEPVTVTWEDAAADPGWCKLDWIVADPARRALANASNMLDVTWEAPDGTITPLDGFIDPYFQEVYLEAESLPLFNRIVEELSADAVDDYVDQLEHEVLKYTTKDPNYGKAARRMYNIFRLTGRYAEAAYLRELFDEPTAVLYQVGAVVRTLDEASQPGSAITRDTLLGQLDALILDVVATLEGEQEVEVVRELLHLRGAITDGNEFDVQSAAVDAARAELTNIVNNFFYDKLTGFPTIAEYMEAATQS